MCLGPVHGTLVRWRVLAELLGTPGGYCAPRWAPLECVCPGHVRAGCAPHPLHNRVGHSGSLEPAIWEAGAQCSSGSAIVALSPGQVPSPSASDSSPELTGGASPGQAGIFTLCLWVTGQCEDTRGLAAWTQVWLCPRCDYDRCFVLAVGLGTSLLGRWLGSSVAQAAGHLTLPSPMMPGCFPHQTRPSQNSCPREH